VLGQRFEARRDIDPVAEDVGIVDDDVADIDADAERDAPVVGAGIIPARAWPLAYRRRSPPKPEFCAGK
jgi:hypothetical protein